jgi:preprotein translocase subunit SecE
MLPGLHRDDIKEGTTVVILMSSFVAIFLSLVDTGFGYFDRSIIEN